MANVINWFYLKSKILVLETGSNILTLPYLVIIGYYIPCHSRALPSGIYNQNSPWIPNQVGNDYGLTFSVLAFPFSNGVYPIKKIIVTVQQENKLCQNILYTPLNPLLLEGIGRKLFFIYAILQIIHTKKRGGSEGDGVCHENVFAVPITLNSYKYLYLHKHIDYRLTFKKILIVLS